MTTIPHWAGKGIWASLPSLTRDSFSHPGVMCGAFTLYISALTWS
jgi:hypothetical protein